MTSQNITRHLTPSDLARHLGLGDKYSVSIALGRARLTIIPCSGHHALVVEDGPAISSIQTYPTFDEAADALDVAVDFTLGRN